ncbi:hypothetical protein FND50_25185 [Rhodococcus sp. WB9]|uniref:hypothetical protein n=1 Tax=Rhodococcus sp. WB9 TaxID=2594007 RepID=UPI001186BA19|nr:hypothetical protein [Rhodococcus sp. WB9]QDQ93726.1 hypothetical protein FND50_25185 [Rhodococcus sp. WB9]
MTVPLKILNEIRAERARQDEKWGEQNHFDGTGPGYQKHAEAARQRCQNAAALGLVSFKDILDEEVNEAYAEDDSAKLRAELIQVAAVAVAWVEKLDREARS